MSTDDAVHNRITDLVLNLDLIHHSPVLGLSISTEHTAGKLTK